jgi:hypothetical protein
MSRRAAALALVLGVGLTGCGGSGSAAAPASPSPVPTVSPTAEATFADDVELRYTQAEQAIGSSTDPADVAQALGAFVSAVGVATVEEEELVDREVITLAAQAAVRAFELAASKEGVARAAAVLEAQRLRAELELRIRELRA